MVALGDFDLSVRMREVVYAIASEAAYDAYPRPLYASVTAVNHAAGQVTIRYPDDATDVVLSTTVLAPEVGATVRVAGQPGKRYVDEIQAGDIRVRTNLNLSGAISATTFTATGITDAFHMTSTNAHITWRNGPGGTRIGYLQGVAAGMNLASELGILNISGVGGVTINQLNQLNLPNGIYAYSADTVWFRPMPNCYVSGTLACGGAAIIAGSVASPGMTLTVNGHIYTPNHINTVANVSAGYPTYFAGQTGDNYIRWYNRAGTFDNGAYQIHSSRVSANVWTDAAFLANTGNTNAGYAMHAGAGAAGTMRMTNGLGVFAFVDPNGTLYWPLYASAFTVGSIRASKQDIEPWPPKPGFSLSAAEQPIKALDIVRQLEVVSYRRLQSSALGMAFPTIRREEARERLNKYRAARGIDLYERQIHECDDSPCTGTSAEPCGWRKNWEQPQFGLIAEDVLPIAPELISYEADGSPAGIDVHSHVTLLHAAIKELEERLSVIEGKAA